MKKLEEQLSRKEMVEWYINYDTRKKGKEFPEDINLWNWEDPNDLDTHLREAGFKFGVITGYRNWDLVGISFEDLENCAIVNHIFPSKVQRLGDLAKLPEFEVWKPLYKAEWFSALDAGKPFPVEWALLLRESGVSEKKTKWYIEDGSGRAITFFRSMIRSGDHSKNAYGYLGANLDHSSNFMKEHF